ncbi:extracellular solute-binding protein [Streptomyces fragilis]|uniref:Extracellular solute-binding protein n=1 Tax=Streptomyces fragilis TaxID=67301 RepID=A0ABV2YQH8_9ACTN|nr:extracellular solute-binding protein [Streptomyces fragilis]
MRRRPLALMAVCAALTTTAACGMLSGGPGRETVTVWLMKGTASADFLRRFTAAFEADHPDTRLDIRIQEWTGIGPKVQAAMDPEENPGGPDVIEVGNTQVPQYVEGQLFDLTLEAVRDWGVDDCLPGLADPGRDRNQQYGIPWYAANRVVVYRKDLFEEAGVTPPRTREEWLEVTRRLDSTGSQGIYLAGQDWYTLAGFIWDEGGDLAVERTSSWEGALHTPEALRGMEFYRQLHALGEGPADADEEHPPQAGVFAEGRTAQIIAVPGVVQTVLAENPGLKDKIGYFPVPGKDADRPGAVFTGGSDLIVPRNTDQAGRAIDVIGALVSEKWATDLARTMNYVPNKEKLAGAVADNPGVAAMAEGAAQGRATPSTPEWAEVEADNPIKRYMTAVLEGGDARREAEKASEHITEVLNPVYG